MSDVKKLVVEELYKPARKNFPRRNTIIKGLDDLWQIDLAEFPQHTKENKGHKFILIVIDCFSKYLWTRPLKSKTAQEVSEAMEDILSSSEGRHPRNLQSDQGTEFYNAKFNRLMKKYNIRHYSTFSSKKASMAERVIRTIKERIHKSFNLRGTYKWIDILQDITRTYNTTPHSKIRMKPIEVNRSNEKALLKSCYGIVKQQERGKKIPFTVGDVVRISKEKTAFEKGYTPRWSTELFKVVQVLLTTPTTYLLEDLQGTPISGCFYGEELQKTSHPDIYLIERVIRKKGSKLYVKWLGLGKEHNSWIDAKDIK